MKHCLSSNSASVVRGAASKVLRRCANAGGTKNAVLMASSTQAPAGGAVCASVGAVGSRRWKSGGASPWTSYEMAPFDPIIGLTEQFKMDDYPQKVNVGVGAYRTDEGLPYVLPCVREAERRLMEADHDMEYSGIVSR